MPACWSFAITAVIASAFIRCASEEFFDRDSAAMVTNARSGAAMIVACPMVTTTGEDGRMGSCARACGATATQIARIRTFFFMNALNHRGLRGNTEGEFLEKVTSAGGVRDAEADAVGVAVRRHLVAMGAAQVPAVR